MGARRIRLGQRQRDQADSRIRNGHRKRKERERREVRMRELLSKGKPPYTPAVRSWLSAKLGKPSQKITASDVEMVLQQTQT